MVSICTLATAARRRHPRRIPNVMPTANSHARRRQTEPFSGSGNSTDGTAASRYPAGARRRPGQEVSPEFDDFVDIQNALKTVLRLPSMPGQERPLLAEWARTVLRFAHGSHWHTLQNICAVCVSKWDVRSIPVSSASNTDGSFPPSPHRLPRKSPDPGKVPRIASSHRDH